MKKLICTIAVTLATVLAVNAQEVGQVWVGGSAGFDYIKPKEGDSYTSYKILPEVGYQLQENLGVAVRLGYAHSELGAIMNNVELEGEVDMFQIAPFVRYSFVKGDAGSVFIDGGVGYAHGKEKLYDTKVDLLEVGFRPGVSINLTEKFALTGNFGFLGYQSIKSGEAKTNRFSLDFDMSEVLLGVNVKF